MINLQKEREAFEDQWKKNGYFHFNLERKNGEERYSHRHVNFSFKFWCQRAELAQAEITELKQKLEKLESGEFVLVPREPTKEVIIGLASGYFSEDGSPWLDPEESYREMLSAIAAVESGKFNSDIQAMNKDLSNGVITGENFDNISDDRSGGESP